MPPRSSTQPEYPQPMPGLHALAANAPESALEVTRVIFDAAPIGLIIFDEKYDPIDCNSFMLAMLGVEKEHFLNCFYELSPEYQPDGAKSSDKAQDLMKRAMGGEKLVIEWSFLSPSGDLVPTQSTIMRIFNDGKHIGVGYVYDLRTIKHLESDIVQLKSDREQIYYDALTGIYNRRFFDENLDRVVKTLSRSGGILSLMMIDIDNFKDYNDTYGHSAGDACLKTVAELLSKSITRADDFIVRYGGDEFAVVLPNTDEDGARLLAEKMLESIRNHAIVHEKFSDTGIVAISIGVTTGRVDTSHTAEDYINRADELLYASKHSGRNKSTFKHL